MLEEITQHKKLLLILGGVLLILLVLFFLIIQAVPKRKTEVVVPNPTAKQIKEPPSIKKTELPELTIRPVSKTGPNGTGTTTYVLSEQHVPKTLPVYSFSSGGFSDSFINILVQTLAPGGTKGDDEQLWSSSKEGLSLRINNTFIEYTSGNTPSDKTLQQEEIVGIANRFLYDLDLISSYQLDVGPEIAYFMSGAGDLVETTNIDEANIFDLSYPEVLEEKRIYRQYGSSAQIHVWVARDGTILRLSYKQPLSVTATHTVDMLTLDEAKALMGSLGVITRLGSTYQEEQYSSLLSTELTELDVGYLEDRTKNILLPIFVFRGTSTTGFKEVPITIYLPAYK